MKKLSLIMCMCVLTVFAAGCNNNDDAQKDNQANDNQTTENNNANDTATDNNNANNQATDNNTGTNTNDSAYSFRDFDLEVKYENNKDYEVSYENDNDGVEASIEDDRNNERVNGNDAVDRLNPIFKKLDIDSNTSQDDVISKVISAFELDDNYQAIDIDISFNDGTEKEYRNNK
ncbi:hypothetical protein F7984_03920 [Pradoshia sp. D12]|uniref:YusW family protein n=1 Tax=Bacillaceae TaxID=186817 RepID=UPI00080AD0C7|nr:MULTISPECIES: YusW family protein [Bacillaceae]OCA90145.1 hypothetical protein A8L44_04270 [Bacillus sp. FJAT-27986]QFK70448.1 hypothetical protein F7984_03920 [Pradoshia sp. D12]TPF72243.1 hypothetical protein FHY44_00315 [Bacillus sp. D12]